MYLILRNKLRNMITNKSIDAFRETKRILIREKDFMYLLPHPALKHWISNYTITFPGNGLLSDDYTVIPHGSATLVFLCDGERISSTFFGPAVQPACVGKSANQAKMIFIIEFQPAGFFAFSEMPQKELTNHVLPFEMMNPVLNRLLTRHIESAKDIHGLITEADRLFFACLKDTSYQSGFSLAREMIIKSGGIISTKELLRNVYYSERHIGRIFDKYMGMNIKLFSRLVRVNKAARLLHRPGFSMTQIFLQCRFYDMPHFVHDFKSICGITPQTYRNNMSDFYNEIAKF